MEVSIVAENVGKEFSKFPANRPPTLKDAMLGGFRGMKPTGKFWGLRDVSFTVSKGQMMGVIGRNGAGKSTLLNLLGEVSCLTEGSIRTTGRIGGLLDLGAGFSPDLTGRENVFINGVVAGLTRAQVAQRLQKIAEFAELEDYLETPLRTYSTGMQMRLAFSITAHCNPDILLVDEFLSVGDLAFQTKCLKLISEMRENGCTIVLVSHNMQQVQDLCDHVLWLSEGTVAAHGSPEQVAERYTAAMQAETHRRTPSNPKKASGNPRLEMNKNRHGSLEGEITNVSLLPHPEIRTGEPLRIRIEYNFPQELRAPIFSASISSPDGRIHLDVNTAAAGLHLPSLRGSGVVQLLIDRLDLAGGEYFVDAGIHEAAWTYTYDYHWHVYPLRVNATAESRAPLCPPCRWTLTEDKDSPSQSASVIARGVT